MPAPGLAEARGAEPEQAWPTGTLSDALAAVAAEADVRALPPVFAALANLQFIPGRPAVA